MHEEHSFFRGYIYDSSLSLIKGTIMLGFAAAILSMVYEFLFFQLHLIPLSVIVLLLNGACFLFFRNRMYSFSALFLFSGWILINFFLLQFGFSSNIFLWMWIAVLFIFLALVFISRIYWITAVWSLVMINIAMAIQWNIVIADITTMPIAMRDAFIYNFMIVGISMVVRLTVGERSTIKEKDQFEQPKAVSLPIASESVTICFVDDDEDTVEIYAKFFESKKITVLPFHSATQLREWVETHGASFDLLITDFFLQESDGKIVIELIRKLNPAMPIILMSGFPLEKLSFNIDYYDNVTFIQKPFSPRQLMEQVRKILAGGRS